MIPKIPIAFSTGTPAMVRIPIAKVGSFVKGKDRFSISRATLADVVRNFRKRKADTVIDYEHASEYPEDARGEAIPAAGWVKAIDDEPDSDGVLYGQAEFTPRAQAMLAKREYKYLSPVIDWGKRDAHTGEPQGPTLTSVALTNRPFLEEMPAVSLPEAMASLLNAKAMKKVQENPELPYHEALKLAAREEPELARMYTLAGRERRS